MSRNCCQGIQSYQHTTRMIRSFSNYGCPIRHKSARIHVKNLQIVQNNCLKVIHKVAMEVLHCSIARRHTLRYDHYLHAKPRTEVRSVMCSFRLRSTAGICYNLAAQWVIFVHIFKRNYMNRFCPADRRDGSRVKFSACFVVVCGSFVVDFIQLHSSKVIKPRLQLHRQCIYLYLPKQF